MTKFRFDTLLKVRESERNEIKNAFLLAQSQLLDARDKLQKQENELAICQEEARHLRASSTIRPDELRQNQRFLYLQIKKRNVARQVYEDVVKRVEELRQKLEDAIKDVKILESLKEKMEERRLENERRRSDKEMDELATQQKVFERQKANKNASD